MSMTLGSQLARATSVLGSSAVVAAGVLIAAPAQAAPAFNCGITITRSVTLHKNIDCRMNKTDNALTIGAAGVTVNLNGHKILGPGDANKTVGILDNGFDKVTIEGGTISNFNVGISVSGLSSTSEVTGLVVKEMTVTENTVRNADNGILANYLRGAKISGLSVHYADDGTSLTNSQHNSITDNKIISPGADGFYDNGGDANTYSHNTVTGLSGNGIESSRTTGLVITFNTITGDYGTGIYDNQGSGLSASGNTLSGLLHGIEDQQGSHNTYAGNKAIGDADGLQAYNCDHGNYTGNTFSDGQYGIDNEGPVGDVMTRNITNGNSHAGIYVSAEGITGSAAKLSFNTADYNGFGLYSEFHVTGRGNHAKGNKVVNCHNVTCVR